MGGVIDLRDNRREQAINAGYENIISGLSFLAQQKDRERALARQAKMDELTYAELAGKFETTPEALQEEVIVDGKTTRPGLQKAMSSYSKTVKEQRDWERRMKERELDIKEKEATTKNSLALTPGQKKLDQEFAKDYNTFQSQGGFADAQKGIDQLREVSSMLGKSDNLTGPFIEAVPMPIRKRILPDSVSVQQAVEEVVQRNLRLILGAQFTEKEGTRLIERAFDPSLSEAENKKRVDRLLNQMETALYSKQKYGEYFSKYGTLEGFDRVGQMSRMPAQQEQRKLDIETINKNRNHANARRMLQYAKENPQDPRSKVILESLGEE